VLEDADDPARRPLAGVRVRDFGVIVMGAEIARLYADQGAEVLTIENRAYPDGARAQMPSGAVHPTFALGHRNSKSLGLNLRVPEGIALFKRLVAISDVVLSNFKPGTMEGLGLGYETLRAINPRLVMVSSSAVGATGPWSTWMGYGPLVRAASGVTSLWRYPEDPESFSDGITIFPDHFAGRVGAVAGLAALIARLETGRGAHVRLSQAEAILTLLSALFLEEHLRPGSAVPIGDRRPDVAPWGVFPCTGEDEWCVVCVGDDAEWRALRTAMGDPAWARAPHLDTTAGRLAHRDEVDGGVRAWTERHAPREVTRILQDAGVAAGFMQRITEYEDDPHLTAREFLLTLEQPGLDPMPVEAGPFRAAGIPVPATAPAPEHGQHTRELAGSLLGLDAEEIEALLAAGVLEEPVAAPTT
jgi:crotonobetainyl-CoA:carnitine CoA-transferase CaiB-like acyl-CoA transferase